MSKTKKQTAVEWLDNKLQTERYLTFEDFEQAKAMEKEQIIDAWDNAAIDATYGNKFSSPEQYYNETYETI